MSFLLDTHVFLWIVGGGPLSQVATEIILDPSSELYLSAASYWEICIKTSLGKLELSTDWSIQFADVLMRNSIGWLDITPEAARRVVDLPFHHRDPFDRMLIAQAMEGRHRLLSADQALRSYQIELVW